MRCLPIFWSCLLLLASILPVRLGHHNGLHGGLHEAVHVVAFCATALTFSAFANTGRSKAVYFIWALFLAVVTEWLETITFHNRFEWKDVALDLAGVVLGLVIVGVGTNLLRAVQGYRNQPHS
jgi:uncharacterized protein YfiM (DUF2279 family)